jgi:hypothetical protein
MEKSVSWRCGNKVLNECTRSVVHTEQGAETVSVSSLCRILALWWGERIFILLMKSPSIHVVVRVFNQEVIRVFIKCFL